MKKLLLSFLVLTFASSLSAKVPDECKVEYKHYDESHVVYSADFAKKYDLPNNEDIVEMPEYLQFLEMRIRTEDGEPRCHLNIVYDNVPDILKVPEKEFHLPRFNSAFSKNFYNLANGFSGRSISEKTIYVGLINKNNTLHFSQSFVYDLYVKENGVFVATSGLNCYSGYLSKDEVLLIEKANPEATYDEVRRDDKPYLSLFYKFDLPTQWIEKLKASLSEIEATRNVEKECTNKINKEKFRKQYKAAKEKQNKNKGN